MQKRKRLLAGISAVAVLAILSVGLFGFSGANAQGRGIQYEITVTNITKGQILSPAVVAVHDRNAPALFTLGEEARKELVLVAEDAMLDPLAELFKSSDRVDDVQILSADGNPIMPGQSASVTVSASNRIKEITLAGMLVTTNDAFYALNGVALPLIARMDSHTVPAYDAGSEANTEDCAHIPGPPCGNAGVRVTDGAEGYVYISNGIHSMDEDGVYAPMHDWHNPVALITIERK
jgi:hypothetical protein